jgi:uncharacterized protein
MSSADVSIRVGSRAGAHRMRLHRTIRKVHIWVGAWGAIAAVLFGVTGFMQNHRAILKIPQGSTTEVSRVDLNVPEQARNSPEALLAWLANSQQFHLEMQRGPQGQRAAQGTDRRANHWMLVGGNVRTTIQGEYTPGASSLTVRTSEQSPMAVLSRLHKGNGGGVIWTILSDSFALGMIALGISGLIMWSRGRTPAQMVLSVVGVAVLVLGLVTASVIL